MIMLFKGNSSRLEHLIEKIQANKENHDVTTEEIKEALGSVGSVGSAAGSSWPSSTPEPSPSPASTPSADAADADAEPPFTLGATEHTPYQCQLILTKCRSDASFARDCSSTSVPVTGIDHLKIHMKTHDNQKPFQCTAHMASAHGVDAAALTPPRRVASQPPPTLLACMYCTRDTFTSMEQLQLHVRAAHSALLNGEAMSVVDQPAPTDLSRRASDDATPAKRPRSGSGTPQTTLSPNTLLCNQCDAALPDFEAFRAHLKGHLEEGGELIRTSPAPCVHCGATFADAAASERHLTAHYLAVSCEYTCHSCARSFPTPDDLQKHLLDLHAHHLYRCSLCKEIFDSKVAIQVWVCRGCGSGAGALRSEADGVAHVRARHGGARCSCGALLGGPRLRPRAYRCPVPTCSDAFAVQYLLERHMQVLNGELTRPKRVENNNGTEADGACSPCTTTEPTAPAGEERRRKNGAVALQCAYCGERARSRAELEAHTRAHSGAAAARHKCLICDEILPSAAVLAEHKLTHCKVVAGDTCSRCRARLLSEESFLNHMARHHPALPAPCVAHLIEHTFAGIGAFTCYLCSAVFTSAAGLQRHLPEHASAPRPYDCSRCGIKFFFRAELDNHAFVHLEEAEIAQRVFYEAYARGAASAWAALAPPEPPHVTTPAPEVKQEPEIKEERNDEYIEVASPPPSVPPQPPSIPTPPPVVKQEKPDED
ncbi:Uncharacterized protein OBRU01_02025 [Operophtera brumata]|uniref:C2H2-type domain-containing protein n=1 Tax=Operophtera brumata TaxID=104452 RepID=A0A0L7LSL0_OPEBR|nr:Uncharacterized protein OBRU01_02025 [Operophtera brumata]